MRGWFFPLSLVNNSKTKIDLGRQMGKSNS